MSRRSRSVPRIMAAATLTLVAARAESGVVLARTIHLVRGVHFDGVVAELDMGICNGRSFINQSALVSWGDGQSARGDIVVSTRTPGLVALVSQHTYASAGVYTVSVEVEVNCNLFPQNDRISSSAFDRSSGSVSAVVTSTPEALTAPNDRPQDFETVGRTLGASFAPSWPSWPRNRGCRSDWISIAPCPTRIV